MGNLGLNLGFSAAAFVGLGGLKGVATGTKLAKMLTKSGKVVSGTTKLFGETEKIGKLAKSTSLTTKAEELKKSFDVVNKFAKETNSSQKLGAIADKAKELGNEAVLTEIGKISGFSEQLAKSKKKTENVSTSYLALSLSLLSFALNFPVYKEKIGADFPSDALEQASRPLI